MSRGHDRGIATYTAGEAANAELGLLGFHVISDTVAHEGSYRGFLVLSDCVVAESSVARGDALPAGSAIAAGVFIPGPFTSITLTSGSVLAYWV